MTDLKHQFAQLKEDLALTSEERSAMRTALIFRMNARQAEVAQPSAYLRYFFMQPTHALGVFTLLLVVLAGGTSVSAADALPGDVLYAVKVRVNENVERSLARTPEDKAVIDIKHAEERLAEVELLAAEDGADENVIHNASLAVEEKVERAAALADTLAKEGDTATADDIHSHLNATLLAHADILDAQAEPLDQERQRGLRSLSFAVAHAVDSANTGHDEDRGDDDMSAIALARETGVEARITLLQEKLNDEHVPEETAIELDAELAAVQAQYGDARQLSVDQEYEEAGRAYAEVGRHVSRALAILESSQRIEEKTGKEVVVSFGQEEEPVADMIMAKSAAPALEATTMMMAVEATTTEELQTSEPQRSYDRPFRFFVRDRTEEGI